MKFEFVQNYIKSPLLVYDGCEPKKIIFKIKDKNGKLIDKLDLWECSEYHWQEEITTEEFEELNRLLRFPKERLLDEEEIVSHIKHGSGLFSLPAYIAKAGEGKFSVYFTLAETQPARYQCYVLAVLQTIE